MTPEQIIRALVEGDEFIEGEYGSCVYCRKDLLSFGDATEQHTPDCPIRLGREWLRWSTCVHCGGIGDHSISCPVVNSPESVAKIKTVRVRANVEGRTL